MASTQKTGSALVATSIALAILIALGVWQLQRRTWKAAILARIDQAEAAPPVPLGDTPLNFAKVVATGTLQPQTTLYGVDVRDTPNGPSRMGAQLLQVMRRPNLPPLLVDRGWVPDGAKPPPPPTTPVSISGYVRRAEAPTIFSPADDPDAGHFYTLNPAAIGRCSACRTSPRSH